MNSRATNRRFDEQGAALILTVAFMVVIGLISGAVISRVTSGIQDRVALDQARNREYAADAAIETTVVAARGLTLTLIGTCPAPAATPFSLNNVKIHVDCSSVPIAIVGSDGVPKLQKNLSFVACLATGSGGGVPCTSTNTIITAQVNFQISASNVTTFVQAWSVNG